MGYPFSEFRHVPKVLQMAMNGRMGDMECLWPVLQQFVLDLPPPLLARHHCPAEQVSLLVAYR